MYRQLTSIETLQGKTYKIITRTSLVRSKDFILAITVSVGIVVMLLIIAVYIVNTITMRSAWLPFYKNLELLKNFSVEKNTPLQLRDSDIDEFQQRLMQLPDSASDLVFENVQARLRTLLLMSRGFVIGTGDMSEQALGWSTYNADHMSMYNVNTSVPKSLVRFLVRHVASQHVGTRLAEVLLEISDTPISPELLPTNEKGEIRQDTESTVGPYELHDFFLYHFIRYGASREKILYLASNAIFENEYSRETIESTLDTFFRRFFSNQFKRNCVPDGPKVGSVSLSPRGDWRMPSDADSDAFEV